MKEEIYKELKDDEPAVGEYILVKGNKLFVLDSFFIGSYLHMDKVITTFVQYPCTYNGYFGTFVQYFLYLVSLLITRIQLFGFFLKILFC